MRRTKFPLVKMAHYFDKNKAWRCGQVVKETKTSVIVYTAYREKEIVPRDKIIREEFVTSDRAYFRPRRKIISS
jgi:RNase P/RNase MRP subunit p29